MTVPNSNISEFAARGYTLARGLFALQEVAALREHFHWVNREHQRAADNIRAAATRSRDIRASCSRTAGTAPA